jgi:hypothetical protein
MVRLRICRVSYKEAPRRKRFLTIATSTYTLMAIHT